MKEGEKESKRVKGCEQTSEKAFKPNNNFN